MATEKRKFPRLPFARQGELEWRRGGDAIRLPVVLRTVSCEGASIETQTPDVVHKGDDVLLRFEVARTDVELPARVVWASGSEAGVRLQLALAARAARTTFAGWVVRETQSRARLSPRR